MDVEITGSSTDDNLDNTTFQVIDEYGKIQPEISSFGQTIQLEAKRDGKDKDGRRYVIKVKAEDQAGNIAEAEAFVIVSHDKGV